MSSPLRTTLRLSLRTFHLHSPLRFSTRSASLLPSSPNPLDPLAAHRLNAETRAYYTRRSWYAASGAAVCVIATVLLISTYDIPPKPDRSDAPPGRGLGVRKAGEGAEAGVGMGIGMPAKTAEEAVDLVPTGTPTVPFFPRTISLPSATSSTSAALPAGIGDADEPYQLVGLGIRTVSFLGIQVYVVGFYIAVSDIAALQARLVKKAAGIEGASALVAGEKERLKGMLLDAEASVRIWDEVLRESGVRSVLRIVPTRNTDFAHLRDGWVRGITARAIGEAYNDEGFGQSVAAFKGMFGGKGKVGKGKVLMLERGREGGLGAWVEGEGSFTRMGEVGDERVARLVWLGYLAGKSVASEGARRSVVDGVMEFVERPVGTVETQVV